MLTGPPPKFHGTRDNLQIHLDLWVEDLRAAHEEAMSLGARLLKPADDLEAAEGFQCMPTLPGTRSAFAGADRDPHAAGVASARLGTSPETQTAEKSISAVGATLPLRPGATAQLQYALV